MYIVFNIILAIQMDLSHYPLNRLEMVIRSILHNKAGPVNISEG